MARLPWVVTVRYRRTCSATHGGTARPTPSSATLTNHDRSSKIPLFTHRSSETPTTDGLLVAAEPTGSPPLELRPRGLVEEGQSTWKHSAGLCCRCLLEIARAFVFCTGQNVACFRYSQASQKTVLDQLLVTHRFSFIVVYRARRLNFLVPLTRAPNTGWGS